MIWPLQLWWKWQFKAFQIYWFESVSTRKCYRRHYIIRIYGGESHTEITVPKTSQGRQYWNRRKKCRLQKWRRNWQTEVARDFLHEDDQTPVTRQSHRQLPSSLLFFRMDPTPHHRNLFPSHLSFYDQRHFWDVSSTFASSFQSHTTVKATAAFHRCIYRTIETRPSKWMCWKTLVQPHLLINAAILKQRDMQITDWTESSNIKSA